MTAIYLRALEPEDYKTSIKWRKDDATWALLGGIKRYVSEACEKKWVEDAIFAKGDIKLAVCTVDSDLLIGYVYLNKVDFTQRSAVIGCLIGDVNFRGKGCGREAMRQLLVYAFSELGLHRISAYILESNIPSQKAVQKLGFKKEGLLRDSVFKGGAWQNQVIFAVLDSEFIS